MVNPHFIDFPIVFKMEMEIFALVVLQSIHDRRKKRRAVNRHLRGVAEEFQPISHNNTVDRKQSDHFSPSADGNGELKRMWKHLVSKTRSAAEVRRIRRAWERMVTSESSTQENAQAPRRMREADNYGQARHVDWKESEWEPYYAGSWEGGDYETVYNRTTQENNSKSRQSNSGSSGSDKTSFQRARAWNGGSSSPLDRRVSNSLVILGLDTSCLPTMIALKKAFLKCAMVHHPDRHATDPEAAATAEVKFKEVQSAFQVVLQNIEK